MEEEYHAKYLQTKRLKVKLVIVEIHQTNTQRSFRQLLSPIMNTFHISPQFGMFHSALVVGPW